MIQRSPEKHRGRYFIRVLLCSGTRFDPMGDEELTVFCECDPEKPLFSEGDKDGLLKWVNSNPKFIKNQSGYNYIISEHPDSMSVIFLSDKEIQACQTADRIFH
jgi:hypothetical protein